MGQAVGGLVVTLIGIAMALAFVLVLRELWCWLLKLTAIHEELRVISAYLKAMNEREAKRDAPPVIDDGWTSQARQR